MENEIQIYLEICIEISLKILQLGDTCIQMFDEQ